MILIIIILIFKRNKKWDARTSTTKWLLTEVALVTKRAQHIQMPIELAHLRKGLQRGNRLSTLTLWWVERSLQLMKLAQGERTPSLNWSKREAKTSWETAWLTQLSPQPEMSLIWLSPPTRPLSTPTTPRALDSRQIISRTPLGWVPLNLQDDWRLLVPRSAGQPSNTQSLVPPLMDINQVSLLNISRTRRTALFLRYGRKRDQGGTLQVLQLCMVSTGTRTLQTSSWIITPT